MVRFHKVNGVRVQFTTDEETARDAEEKAWSDGALNRALQNLRDKRNNLLVKTDWTSSSDLTMSSEMTTYRQQLRDAPSGLDTIEKVQAYEFPDEVTK
tara:strand:+ start:797 stop:1090 length:294 start_codon:yes stop_codon:yes gene_type:complete